MHIRKFLAGALSLICLTTWPLVSAAHTHVERSNPENHAHLTTAPKMVEVWFSDKTSAEWSSIEVTDASGKRVDKGKVTDAGDEKHLQVELESSLPSGEYHVKLNVISGDGHRVKTSFSFNID